MRFKNISFIFSLPCFFVKWHFTKFRRNLFLLPLPPRGQCHSLKKALSSSSSSFLLFLLLRAFCQATASLFLSLCNVSPPPPPSSLFPHVSFSQVKHREEREREREVGLKEEEERGKARKGESLAKKARGRKKGDVRKSGEKKGKRKRPVQVSLFFLCYFHVLLFIACFFSAKACSDPTVLNFRLEMATFSRCEIFASCRVIHRSFLFA